MIKRDSSTPNSDHFTRVNHTEFGPEDTSISPEDKAIIESNHTLSDDIPVETSLPPIVSNENAPAVTIDAPFESTNLPVPKPVEAPAAAEAATDVASAAVEAATAAAPVAAEAVTEAAPVAATDAIAAWSPADHSTSLMRGKHQKTFSFNIYL